MDFACDFGRQKVSDFFEIKKFFCDPAYGYISYDWNGRGLSFGKKVSVLRNQRYIGEEKKGMRVWGFFLIVVGEPGSDARRFLCALTKDGLPSKPAHARRAR